MKKHEITLVIDKFTPATIPMGRLAAYMREFAVILGSDDNVHFKKLGRGSTRIAAVAADHAAPKVRARLDEVIELTAPRPALNARQDVDDMLASDNAVGHVEFDGARIIEFPGRLRPAQEKIGPVRRATDLDGQIYQIGGKDETINVHMRGRDGEIRFEAGIELARRMAPFLLLGRVRVFGEGEWWRVNGKWERHNFFATDFIPLDRTSLTDSIKGIQGLFSGVSADDFLSVMAELRQE